MPDETTDIIPEGAAAGLPAAKAGAKTVLKDGKFTHEDEKAEAKKTAKAALAGASLSGAKTNAELREIIKNLAQAVGVKIGE